MDNLSIITPDFIEKIEKFKKEWYEFYRRISSIPTPEVDGNGKKIINKKLGTRYDYIEETYMRDLLDKEFPGWSWEEAAPLHFLGSEWVVAQGHLIIIDLHLLSFGINPPVRKFYGVDAVRIQYLKDMPHIPENLVDIGDNCKQAVTAALKYAINRMTRIGDDVYCKRLEYDGAGTLENVLMSNPNLENFKIRISKHKGILWSEILLILRNKANINNLEEIKDFNLAYDIIKTTKGWTD